jgi:hypothetical protein
VTRVQADIIPMVKDWLQSRITDAQVRLNVPEKWSPTSTPVLVVADDGGPVIWPIKSQHTIRLTAYGSGRTQVRAIAAKAAGLLGYGRPSGVDYIDSDMGGILDARDPETGAFLASVLLVAHAKTVEV